MKRIQFALLTTVILCFSSVGLAGQGYRITLHINDLPEKDVILSHRLGLKFYTDDTVKTDTEGKAVFEADTVMPEGMYQIVFPDKKYSEFFLCKNQIFGISTRASAPSDSLSFSGSAENSQFHIWQQNYASNRSRSALIQNRIKKGNLTPDSTKLLNKELRQLLQTGNRLWDSAIHDLDGSLPGIFIKGLRPVKIPESLVKVETQEGQVQQYQYLRAHFFDDVDFTDERLLRTPLIETKLDQYFRQVIPPVPDTIIRDARKIIERCRPAKTTFQYVVQYLFNLYSAPEIMGTDAVYVFLAENYYLAGQTPWIDSANLQGIGSRVRELKPLLLGKVAPALDGLVGADDQPFDLSSIKSKYLVLYFWSPDCGFCKEATPRLHAQYADLKQMGIEVVALNTRIDKDPWIKFIAEKQLNWINAYSPQKVKVMIENFQAFSTPTLYILDAERKIIAKSISVDQVKPFFTQYLAAHKTVTNGE